METAVEHQDEDDVSQAGGIKSWANAPVEKALKLFAVLPTVSKEVALKVAEQLPEIRKMATKALSGMEKAHKRTLKANEESQKHVHHAYQDIRDVLKGELKEEDMTFDQKKEIYDLLMDTGKQQFAKDSENKRALDTWLKTAGVVAVAALAVCVVLAGAKNVVDEA
ncbi:MAG: hypothetical protein JWQ12_1759 [Glaciihabitans sp.]|nr:hypothetical protein [Glaciihabitans sp.]